MSLPSREELLEASRGLGFAERIKYGAKLGYDHETNPALHTLLQSVRNVRPDRHPRVAFDILRFFRPETILSSCVPFASFSIPLCSFSAMV